MKTGVRHPASRLGPALVAALLLAALPAFGQYTFPRIGLSASAEAWVDSITVQPDETFTLYACVFGHDPGQALAQPLSELSWVVHQVCCGAWMNVLAVDLNPAFQHVGESPLSGMVAVADGGCIDSPGIRLATLTVQIVAPGPGQYLWAAGPYALAHDCQGGEPIFMDMPVTVTVTGETADRDTPWGAAKAMYR